MERVQLVDQVRTPGTPVDAAHIYGKSSKRRVSRCPTQFAIPKRDRGVVLCSRVSDRCELVFVMLIREVGAMKCDLRRDHCVRPDRWAAWLGRDHVACIEIATALAEIDPIYIIFRYI